LRPKLLDALHSPATQQQHNIHGQSSTHSLMLPCWAHLSGSGRAYNQLADLHVCLSASAYVLPRSLNWQLLPCTWCTAAQATTGPESTTSLQLTICLHHCAAAIFPA
jgi:hypothetical protein